jgi:hypothetical protein
MAERRMAGTTVLNIGGAVPLKSLPESSGTSRSEEPPRLKSSIIAFSGEEDDE